MNALDELEALSDSMDSLNSIDCEDDEICDISQRAPSDISQPEAKALGESGAPLLVDDDEKSVAGSDVDQDELSLCSFGSTADLSACGSTPLPVWIEVRELPVV